MRLDLALVLGLEGRHLRVTLSKHDPDPQSRGVAQRLASLF